ncbi:MAG: hypothetical protein ACO1RX_15580 [Candidatus Sericytochromatia bacterium]
MIVTALAWLEAHTEKAFVVGGCLRHMLLKQSVDDYDLIVPQGAILLAKELARQYRFPWLPLDEARDIARVIVGDISIDLAAYGQDLIANLWERDLSINAMAYPLTSDLVETGLQKELLIDPTGGLQDLQLGLLRGVAEANFRADPLRSLRVFRFQAQLGFEIEAQTLNWVKQVGLPLEQLSRERVIDELFRILAAPFTMRSLENLQQVDILAVLFPPPSPGLSSILRLQEDLSGLSGRQILFSLEFLVAGKRSCIALLRFLLLQTIPWTQTRSKDYDDWIYVWRLSRDEARLMQQWLHAAPFLKRWLETGDAVSLWRVFQKSGAFFGGVIALVWAWSSQTERASWRFDAMSLAPMWATPLHPIAHPVALINGQELMQGLNINAGPQVGFLLEALQEAQIRGEITNSADALSYAQTLLTNQSQ